MRPTFSIILNSQARRDGLRPVILRVTFMRQSRKHSLHRYCLPEQWDAGAARFRKSFPGWNKENDILRTYEQRAADALRDFEREGVRFTFEAFEQRVFQDRIKQGVTVWEWMLKVSEQMRESGRYGNGTFYRNVAAVVRAFAKGATLQDIDSEWLARFEKWMRKNRDVTDGGISINLRTLRAACNKAVKAKVIPKTWQPFDDFTLSHLKKSKSKRAISLDEMWLVRDADVYDERERFAQHLFMFSFYTRGMNLADIAELKPSSIRGLRVVYARKKTGKQYSIKLFAQAAAIIDRYKGAEYLFPIYTDGLHVTDAQKFDRLKKVAKAVNKALRAIAARVGIADEGFSFYVARHSYASAHKMRGTSIEVIKELMGHSDFRTSEHYLSDFENRVLDDADEGLF